MNLEVRDELLSVLKGVIKGEVRFDDLSRVLYRTDASIYEIQPLGLILPKDEEDVIAAVRIADERRGSILPRGGGTSLAGSRWGLESIWIYPNT